MDWISVDDRLPEVSGTKMFIALFDNGDVAIFSRPWKRTLGFEYITHWMPLPEPPKEGE